MKITETWAVDIRRIEKFFLSQDAAPLSDGMTEEAKCFRCGVCTVRLTPLAMHPVGPVKVPRTLLEISGEEDAAKALYNRFFLRFISAGG